MGVVKQGRGSPVTLFAPGGEGENLVQRMRYAGQVAGTTIGFAWEHSGHFDACARIRRKAERDAAEVRAAATEHRASQAIGFSRGARAIVGALAEGPSPFARIVLAIPPGGSAAGKYSAWLESRPTVERERATTEILVIGNSGDPEHPARVAQAWAQQLGASLELLPSRAVYTDVERVKDLIAEFLQ